MKYVLSTLVLFSSLAFGDTVVLYDDGSTYTLAEGEEVFVSSGDLFKAQGSVEEAVTFSVVAPHSKRDGDTDPVDEVEPVELPPCDELGFGPGGCEAPPEPPACPEGQIEFFNGVCIDEPEESEGGFTFGGQGYTPPKENPFTFGD